MQQPFKLCQESPARHRVCALSTHETLSLDPKSPALPSSKPRVPKAAPRRKPIPSWDKVTEVLESMPHTQLCDLNQQRQQRVRSGEWALLNTLDAHVAMEEHQQKLKNAEQDKQRTREALDAQMQVSSFPWR